MKKPLRSLAVVFFFLTTFFQVNAQFSRAKNKTSVAYGNNYQRISSGDFHSVELRSGTLWSWGKNDYGQLGIGVTDTIPHSSPLQIGADNNWVNVTCGPYQTFALKSDGTLWAWGSNYYGEMGIGIADTNSHPIPSQIGTENNWINISCGFGHVLAIKSNGTLWAWGLNSYGELGNGTTVSETNPIQIDSDSDWVNVSCANYHTLALKSNGTLWTWGYNAEGELGIGSFDSNPHPFPFQIVGNNWTTIAGIGSSSFGLKSDGTLWAWGYNAFGQLGDGTLIQKSSPTQIDNANDWVNITGGVSAIHVIALKADGTLWAWGWNGHGQLGDGTTTDRLNPVQIGVSNGWISISEGSAQTFALGADGTLWSWGANTSGELGVGFYDAAPHTTPLVLDTVINWVNFSAGANYSSALKSDGTIWAVGGNNYGQLGDNTFNQRVDPIKVFGPDNWASVSCGGFQTIALNSNGSLWAWGSNSSGQLGNGSTFSEPIPIPIGNSNNWVAISTGNVHTIALKSDGTLWTWGSNSNGQIGDGTTTDKLTPIQIGNSNDWVSISGGYFFSMALKADGTLWGWGKNDYGQLGDSTFVDKLTPVQIGNSNNWTGISAGGAHTVGLKSDGTLWAWGQNWVGQLGNGTMGGARSTPIQIGNSKNWINISSRYDHNLALKSDGTLWAWGENYFGELGDSTNLTKNSPVKINYVSDVINTKCGVYISTILKADRNFFCRTGGNANGQLGDGTTIGRNYYLCDNISANVPTINTGVISPTSYCAGSIIHVPYTITGSFYNNYFIAQLSDSNGNFSLPSNIGSVYSSTSGIINATLPYNIPESSNYKVRIISSSPIIISNDTLTFSNYFTVYSAVVNPVITQINDTLFSTTDTSYISYQWYLAPTLLQGAYDTLYVPNLNGLFTVLVTDQHGCTGVDSINVYNSCIPQIPIQSLSFQKLIGGQKFDVGYSIKQTCDGGYIVAGTTNSFRIDSSEVYLIKLDITGDTTWTKTYSRCGFDSGYCVIETYDGGFVVGGVTCDNSWIQSQNIYLIKTNALGDALMNDYLSTYYTDAYDCIQQTDTDNYTIVGRVGSNNTDVGMRKIKMNIATEWAINITNRIFGGTGYDKGNSIRKTMDGGHIIVGTTYSFGADSGDVYLIKTNPNGDSLLWARTYGGNEKDEGIYLQQTNDSGYIILANTYDSITDNSKIFLIKTKPNGDTLWCKSYGGIGNEVGYSIQKTNDSGYIVVGSTTSFGAGNSDVYLLKTDSTGILLWSKCYGGAENDIGYSVQQTSDLGYIIAGITHSFGADSGDVYIIKTDVNGNSNCNNELNTSTIVFPYAKPVSTPSTQTSSPTVTVTGNPVAFPRMFNGGVEVDPCSPVTNINEEVPDGSFEIFPNPTNGIVNLQIPKAKFTVAKLNIFNSLGQNIYVEELKLSTNGVDKQIYVDLPAGIYLIQITDENKQRVKKLIIQ
jgi:alpha-tubulin suppressor-like RCC1 family protein